MPNLTDIEHTTFAMMGPIAHTPTRAMPCHCVVFHFSDRVVLLDTGFGSLAALRQLKARHGDEVEMFCTHDQREFQRWTDGRDRPDPVSAEILALA